MIRKILAREYLKGYGDMTEEERKAYDGRVGQWLVRDGERLVAMTSRPMAQSQSLHTITARWKPDDCRALAEGILLMSALVAVADTWLPTQIYMRTAYRSVRQIVSVLLDSVEGKYGGPNTMAGPVTGAASRGNGQTPQPGGASRLGKAPGNVAAKEVPAENTRKGTPAVAAARGQEGASDPQNIPGPVPADGQERNSHKTSGLIPARPRHIDQYVHLLPKDTQERAAHVKGLLTELDEAREKARLMMEEGERPDKIELWARKATRLDDAVKKIYRELDSEWDKLVKQGRVVVDDLGNAYVADPGHGTLNPEPEAEPAELTAEQKQRRRALRKFLVDTRRGNGSTREEHLQKWDNWWREYITLEPIADALADVKIIEAAKHYGIKIGQE